MVLGIDPHKNGHTAVVLEAANGEVVGELTVTADRRGHERLLAWARSLCRPDLLDADACIDAHGPGRRELAAPPGQAGPLPVQDHVSVSACGLIARVKSTGNN